MRDFQTWLVMQVAAARGAVGRVTSELPVCPDYVVDTSQAAEQIIKGTWNGQNKLCLFALVVTSVITLSWGHAFPEETENSKLGPGK